MGSHGMLDTAKVIVAVDFGTTFSGFSYTYAQSGEKGLQNFLETVEGYDNWPSQSEAGVKPYYKTQSSLLYVQMGASSNAQYELKGWGWAAEVEHRKLLQKSGNSGLIDGKKFHFITKFKLALAGQNPYHGDSYNLPPGFTAERVIADYLHALAAVVEKELQDKYGAHVNKKDIQWCLTVPAMWEESAKQQMKKCAEIAGLASGPSNRYGGGSPHPIIIVLEPEAASAFCVYYLDKTHQISLAAQSIILIVDAGGGTVDLVLHERSNSDQMKEIRGGSSGALCGATYVDEAFHKLLARKIPCYNKFILEQPTAELKIRHIWEDFKVGFDGELALDFWLPSQLSKYWEDYSKVNKLHRPDSTYDDVKISLQEMTHVFDSAVNTILDLIEEQISQVAHNAVDVLLVVGGFSNSPYVKRRIDATFKGRVKRILNPTHSGKAVVTGAVAYGCLGKEIVTARIARRTYGIALWHESNEKNMFKIFVRKGEEVKVDHSVELECCPHLWETKRADTLLLEVFSSMDSQPSLVTDPGCRRECMFQFPYPAMRKKPMFMVTMFFGGTSIAVSAMGHNFDSLKVVAPSVTFDT